MNLLPVLSSVLFCTISYQDSSSASLNNTCGPNCVFYLLNQYKIPCSYSDVAIKIKGNNTEGLASFADLVRCLKGYGLKCQAFSLGAFDEIKGENKILLNWGGEHFVVLDRIDGKNYFIWDGSLPCNSFQWRKLEKIVCLLW